MEANLSGPQDPRPWLSDKTVQATGDTPVVIVASNGDAGRALVDLLPPTVRGATIQVVGSDQTLQAGAFPNSAVISASDPIAKSSFYENLLRLLSGRTPSAIISVSEQSQILAGTLRDILGVDGLSHDDAIVFRDKLLMKKQLISAAVPVPELLSSSTACNGPRKHYLLKPRLSQGSSGIKHATAPYATDTQFSSDMFIIEEFIDGEKYHVDALFVAGHLAYMFVSRYIVPPLDFSAGKPGGSLVIDDKDIYERVTNFAKRVIAAMPTIVTGSMHLDVFESMGGTLLAGEIASRPAGNSIRTSLEVAFGVNLVQSSIRAQAGLPVRSLDGATGCRELTAWAEIRSRSIRLLRRPDFSSPPPGVRAVRLHADIGRELHPARDTSDNIASLIVAGTSPTSVLALREKAIEWADEQIYRAAG